MRRHYPAGLTTQQGGALTMMIMALFFGGLLTLAIKIGPAYLDDFTIQEALESSHAGLQLLVSLLLLFPHHKALIQQ